MELPTVYICQKCGRATATREETWLIEPARWVIDTLIIRCPMHITEWSLRQTDEGRTGRLRAKRNSGIVLPPITNADPLPGRFKGARQ